MSSKITYIICIVLCLTGVGLYAVAQVNSKDLADKEFELECQIADLAQVLRHPKTEVSMLKLDYYQNQINLYVDESKRIYDFFGAYETNLNKFFIKLGKPDQWNNEDSRKRKVPSGGRFAQVLFDELQQLSSKHSKILRQKSENQTDKSVSLTFTESKEKGVSPLKSWSGSVPSKEKIFPAMQRFNIGSAVCESVEKVKTGNPIITYIEIEESEKTADTVYDFDHIKTVITVEIHKKEIPNLISHILQNKKILFDVELVEMELAKSIDGEPIKDKLNRMTVKITTNVLVIKKDLAEKRCEKIEVKKIAPKETTNRRPSRNKSKARAVYGPTFKFASDKLRKTRAMEAK